MMMFEHFLCLLADLDVAQKRTVPFFAWSLLESVGLTDIQLQPDSKGETSDSDSTVCLSLRVQY